MKDKYPEPIQDDTYNPRTFWKTYEVPDPKIYRTGTIPPECPLLDEKDENNQQNNS